MVDPNLQSQPSADDDFIPSVLQPSRVSPATGTSDDDFIPADQQPSGVTKTTSGTSPTITSTEPELDPTSWEAFGQGLKRAASTVNDVLNPLSESNYQYFKEKAQNPSWTPDFDSIARTGRGLAAAGKLATAPFAAIEKVVAQPIASGMAGLAAAPEATASLFGKSLSGKSPGEVYSKAYSEMEPGVETALGLGIPAAKGSVTALVPPNPDFGVSLFPAQETKNLQELKQISDATRGRLGREAEMEAGPRWAAQQAEVAQAPEKAIAQISPTGTVGSQDLHDVGQIASDHLLQQDAARTNLQTRTEAALLQLQEGLRQQFGNGKILADTPETGADIIARGLERADEQARATRDAAYGRWGNMEGIYKPQTFTNTTNQIKRVLNDPDDPFILNEQTPGTKGFLDWLDANLTQPAKEAADPRTTAFTPFTPRTIDNVRKQLGAFQQAASNAARSTNNYSDVEGLRRIRNAFDSIISGATRNPRLFSGDGEAVWQAWQDARQAHADWRQTFSPQGRGDYVGPVINKILGQREGQAAPPQQIVNWFTGKGSTPTLVGRRMQQIFEPNSPEIGAIKQMNWSKAVDTPDGVPPLTNIQKAKNIDALRNSDLGRTYFTPQELQQMGTVSGAMRRAAATPGADPIAAFTAKVQAGMPPMEVARTLIPSGQAVDKTFPLALARHLKQTLSPDKWDAVRQGVMRDILTPPRDMANPHNTVVNRIDGVFKNAPDLMNAYFSPQEQNLIRTYQNMSRKLSMPQAAVQTSNHPNYLGWLGSAVGRAVRFGLIDAVAHGVGAPWGWAELGTTALERYLELRAARKATGSLVGNIAKLMPTAADQMAEYQRAVAAANRTSNQIARNRALVAGTNVVNLFKNYGIDLTKMPVQSVGPAAAQQPNQQRKDYVDGKRRDLNNTSEQNRAAGGRVVAKNIDHNPSPAQKATGNYAKDHVTIHGLPITIENAKGSKRKGMSKDGKAWQSVLPNHYGYFKQSEGRDGDHVDVYLGPHIRAPKVWVVDQVDPDTKAFDEHKALLGFGTKIQAINTYRKAFSDGKGLERIGAIHEMTIDELKDWLKNGNTKQPLKRGGVVPTTTGKITRDAFLYLPPRPPKNRFAQCSTCSLWTGGGCLVHSPKIKVTGDMTCGVYVPGNPQFPMKGHEREAFTPEQSGLLNAQVQCQRCKYTSGNTSKKDGCGLYRMLNQRAPEDFTLDEQIESEGCCNAFTSREVKNDK